ncbi:thermonuclease family protein [Sphingosinicella sp. CPCC 101087]|uniref:thermonuclease family protein n=1 Tax=Sphingosinicella sp. CPCC 101087 TaxID=2497754 RepID=UPI00101D4260|nr:thermonuclease family protein [Sphingosinicella sp. CPCC 101087]
MTAPSRFRRRSPLLADIRSLAWVGLLLALFAFHALGWWRSPTVVEAPGGIAAAPADSWTGPRSAVRPGPAPKNGRPAPVGARIDPATVRVVDGDTLDVAGMRVRIADIDTPEIFSPRCPREAELGARATRRLRALVDEGPFELVAIARDEDRYGRKLRIATRGGRSLGDRLVAEGLARTYDGGPRKGWCA